jgi:hypothetical protein
MFLHAGPIHLLVNGYSFFILGRFVERLYGRTQLLAVFLGTGILASLTSYLLTAGLSVGASGGIAGLLGLIFSFVLRYRDRLNPVFRRRFLMNLNMIVLVNIFLGAMVPGIDVWAHAGGFAAGALAGWLARPVLPGGTPGGFRLARPLALGSLTLLLAVWTCLGLYLLFALAAPQISPRSLYSDRNGLFQFRYPAWFTVKQAPADRKDALLVTNLHNATFAVFLIDEADYRARLDELAHGRAERGPLSLNGMEGIRAAGAEHGREGTVFFYQVLLLGAQGTGGEKQAAVFLATGEEPVPAALRELIDRVAESFFFVNRLVI